MEIVIPKQMGFFWADGPMSWLRYMTLASFRKFNPDWRMVLYVGAASYGKPWESKESQDFFAYKGHDYRDQIAALGVELQEWIPFQGAEHLSPVHQSDLFTYWLLTEFGGYYSDLDILFLRPMDEVHNAYVRSEGHTMLCSQHGSTAIGFMGGVAGSEFFSRLLRFCLIKPDAQQYQSVGTHAIYRMLGVPINQPMSEVADRIRSRWPVYELDPRIGVYPVTWRGVDQIFGPGLDVAPSYTGIHWFAGAPLSQEWNCRLTPENFQQFNLSICSHLEKVLA